MLYSTVLGSVKFFRIEKVCVGCIDGIRNLKIQARRVYVRTELGYI